jgi:hypothetical protein
MRCVYCDRSLGILRFRAAEPFCCFEHRKLHYRNADPPIAKLLNADPRPVNRSTAPAVEGWIPGLARRDWLEALPSQTLGEPAVSSTGPLIYLIPAIAEVDFPKGSDRPAPVEFSTVVHIVPPGDEELTAADPRDRTPRASYFTATSRMTFISSNSLISSNSRVTRTYGPEFQIPVTSHPASDVRRAVEWTGPPCDAGFVEVRATPAVRFERPLAPAAGRFELELEVSYPGIRIRNIELPRCQELDSWAPCSDAATRSGIVRLDPIRPQPLSVLTLGPGREAITDHCRPTPCRELCSFGARFKDMPVPTHLIDTKDLTPLKGRFASVFAPVLAAFGARVPLKKTPHDAEHLT